MERLIVDGEVKPQAGIARLCFALEIQDVLLFLPLTVRGRDPIRETHVRPIAAELAWKTQRAMWMALAG